MLRPDGAVLIGRPGMVRSKRVSKPVQSDAEVGMEAGSFTDGRLRNVDPRVQQELTHAGGAA